MRKKRYRILWHRVIIAVILLIWVIVNVIQIISYFSVKRTKYEQTSESRPNNQVETKTSKNTVKMQNSMRRDFCGLHVVICENEQYDEITYKIKKTAEQYDIDWKLAVAIARHETGNYTSELFKEKNNIGGIYVNGEFKKFETLNDGIDYFVRLLKNYYIQKGLDTPEKIQPVYAPIGAKNDPHNLNSHWTSNVKSIYAELKEIEVSYEIRK